MLPQEAAIANMCSNQQKGADARKACKNACIGCKKCISACPKNELGECLSAITQKKGELTEAETDAMIKYNTAWGCDICQRVCPYTEKAVKSGTVFTDIEYFRADVIPDLDTKTLDSLNDVEFNKRAFSWRGRKTVERNLDILKRKETKL